MPDPVGSPGSAWRKAYREEVLRRLAGPRSFERGATYAAEGRVQRLMVAEAEAHATVVGTASYRVHLGLRAGRPAATCSCPVGADGTFCKHAVAVALTVAAKSPLELASAGDGVRAYLEGLAHAALVDLLVERAVLDDGLHRQLSLRAAATTGPSADTAAYRAVIDAAIGVPDFVDYREAPTYLGGVEDVVDGLAELLEGGRAAAVGDLCMYALEALEAAWERIDDSDGGVAEVRDRLVELHHESCVRAPPDPVDLARTLHDWLLRSEFETFLGAAAQYADVLGPTGTAAYRELVAAAWDRLPALRPGDQFTFATERFRLTYAMEVLARAGGDVDELVRVLAHDLSTGYQFVRVAEALAEADRLEEALAWAERGLAAFPERPDVRLRTVAAGVLQRLGRHEEALALAWATFSERLDLDAFEALATHARPAGAWPAWRERAHAALRARLEAERTGRHPMWSQRTASTLVEVLLWERKLDDAWRQAQRDGCSPNLWLELARRREKRHPRDAVPIYLEQIERAIGVTNKRAYAEAVACLRHVRQLLARLDDPAAFARIVAEVRSKHRRKRNLMALLEREGW